MMLASEGNKIEMEMFSRPKVVMLNSFSSLASRGNRITWVPAALRLVKELFPKLVYPTSFGGASKKCIYIMAR